MTEWLRQIDPSDLVSEVPPLLLLDIDPQATLDDVASLIVEGGPNIFAGLPPATKDKLIRGTVLKRSAPKHDGTPPKEWWPLVKDEFVEFLCTDSKRYEDLRKKVQGAGGVTGATLLSIIAAAIGDALGFRVGSIVGLVAICLYGAVRIGKEAFCKLRGAA